MFRVCSLSVTLNYKDNTTKSSTQRTNVAAVQKLGFKCFPKHPKIKHRMKTAALTARWRLERSELGLNFCSSNFKAAESIATYEISLKTSIKPTLKSEQSAREITRLIKAETVRQKCSPPQ